MGKLILQTTASECGLACIAMISNHHGHKVDLFELRNRYTLSLRGATMADLVRIGAELGLSGRAIKLNIIHIPKLRLPAILHWDLNHFVVLIAADKRGVTIHDPAQGEIHYLYSEINTHFTGVALELHPAPEFRRKKEKPPIDWRTLVGRVVGLKRAVVQMILLAAVLQAISLLLPFLTQWIVDGVIVSGDLDLLTVLICGIIILYSTQTFIAAIRSRVGLSVSTQINLQWSSRVMDHILRLPLSYFETRHTGDIVSRFQSLGTIQQTITGVLVESVLDGIFALATGAMMLVYSPLLGIIAIGVIAIYAAIRFTTYQTIRSASSEYIALATRTQSHFLETLRGIQSIKVGCSEEQRRIRWTNMLVSATNKNIKMQLMVINYGSFYGMLFGIESVCVIGLGARMTIGGSMSIGMLLAFLAYKDQFAGRIHSFIDKMLEFRMLDIQIERLADIVLTPKQVTNGSEPIYLDELESIPPSIKFKNIGFRHGSGEPWVFRNLNVTIAPGEHVAVVGPSGCGKSTFAKLLLGLIEPTEGEILINEKTLKQLGLDNWRRQVGAVMQDDQVFSGSIRDNISNFSEHIDFERVEHAARLSGIHNEILEMSMGYATLMGDMGSSLSGGQKQRVLLARALYKQPQALLLDEATSHLDIDLEKRIGFEISKLPLTRVVIAHRTETINMAERIINLGKIKEEKRTIRSPSGGSNQN